MSKNHTKNQPETVMVEHTPTEREKQLVQLLTEGKTASRMALKLGMSESSFSSELATVRAKYDCDNSVQLVAYFLRKKLID